MSRFHPEFVLTQTHRPSVRQLRAVQGAQVAATSAATKAMAVALRTTEG
jgi:hypothetical protein